MTRPVPLRALTALLLAAVLCGKLLVPAGWMPVAAPGGLAVMLCTSDGPTRAWIDDTGTLRKGHLPAGQPAGDDESKDPCPFGLMSAPLAVPPGLALAPPAPAATPAALPARQVAVGRGLAAPPPPPTGPPVSV